jgi:hypothetical protein
LTNLYSNEVPTGNLTVTLHNGSDEVYCAAESATPLLVSQLPSCEIDPTKSTLSPYAVVTRSLNVTLSAVAVAEAHALVVVLVTVVNVLVLVGVLPHSPLPETQEEGTRTRGRPDVMGTGIAPLEPTETELQV